MRILFSLLLLHVASTIYAQDGFISLDCGSPPETNYTENGVYYVSDDGFIETGVRNDTPNNYVVRSYNSVRSFPENKWNCYTLRPQKGKNNKYLIRAMFLYGDRGQPPLFDLYIGGDYWNTPSRSQPTKPIYYEIIYLTSSDYIHVCLLNTGNGPPYITSLELRPLDIAMYEYPNRALFSFPGHLNFGADEFIGHDADKYDRLWEPKSLDGCKAVQSSDTVSLGPNNVEQVPSKVMSTAITPTNSTGAIVFSFEAYKTDQEYIFYVYLAEVEKLETNQKREVNIYINGKPNGPFLVSTSMRTFQSEIFSGSSSYTLIINKTVNSTLPPILNALEVFYLGQLRQSQTDDKDAAAIWSTKSTYGLTNMSWQGDPCFPQEYVWVGLNCSYSHGAANIISLNLSSRGLNGTIAKALSTLTMLQSLDLSYNNLTGKVPELLAKLDNLKILNLLGNNFSKPLPAELIAKQKNRTLLLSIEESGDEDKGSCQGVLCGNNKHKKERSPVATISIALAVGVLLLLVITWIVKRLRKRALIKRDGTLNLELKAAASIKREESFVPSIQQFTYSEVLSITNDLKEKIGEGGYGRVFQGSINGDKQVAVKMLSESSSQGYKEFQAEVKLLTLIHHRNITSLVGYCNDGEYKAIIYEFMAHGNLEKHLYDGRPNVLSWERRLQIGCDAAEGLAYLHHGCTPPIVHRDVKCANILLNENLQAKLADFGLSRAFPTEGATHVSTERAAGTPGYQDPEHYPHFTLREKSDVFSFGVVLLELITGRKAILNYENIVDWVKSSIKNGNAETIIDSRLEGQGGYDLNTVMKVAETAMAYVSPSSIERPTMETVVMDLKHCLRAERDRKSKLVSCNMDCVSGPTPR